MRAISSENAPDIDGWISQAGQLREDIHSLKALSREIVGGSQQGEQLQANVRDADEKLGLLKAEVIYNETLLSILKQLQEVQNGLGKSQDFLADDSILEAIRLLQEAEERLRGIDHLRNARAISILQDKLEDSRNSAARRLAACWSQLFVLDSHLRRIMIHQETPGKAGCKVV